MIAALPLPPKIFKSLYGNCKYGLEYLINYNTGGPRIVLIQTVQLIISSKNIGFYSLISAIPRNSVIFGSHTSIDTNSAISNRTRNF